MNNGKILIGLSIFLIALVVGLTIFFGQQPGKYDSFANCITEKGVTVYESFECSACQAQKGFFGNSHKLLKSFECGSLGVSPWSNPICNEKEIKGVPTWLDGSGSRIEIGAITSTEDLKKLGSLTGCSVS